MTDFSYESAAGIAAAIRTKKVSPSEVLEDTIARIEARNPSLNAFVFKGYDDARAAAKEAGERRTCSISSPAGPPPSAASGR